MNRDDRRSEFWFKEWLRGPVSGLVAFFALAGHVTRALIREGGGKSRFLEALVSTNLFLETGFRDLLLSMGSWRNLEILGIF